MRKTIPQAKAVHFRGETLAARGLCGHRESRRSRNRPRFARLNKVFDGRLEALLGEFADEVWRGAG